MPNPSNDHFACYLTDVAALAVTGRERHAFLQGQLTQDLNLIKTSGRQLSAWCNPKGQVIVNFLIINTGEQYLLLFNASLKALVKKRLALFILRADVHISDVSMPVIGVSTTAGLVVTTGQAAPIITELPYRPKHYLVIGEAAALIAEHNLATVTSEVWCLSDIFAGVPWVTAATGEKFLPQFLNLDRLDSLSYQKGCYPGQEVIARLHYRGTVNKRLQRVQSPQALAVGATITTDATTEVGCIINAAKHTDGNYYALATVQVTATTAALYCQQQRLQQVTNAAYLHSSNSAAPNHTD